MDLSRVVVLTSLSTDQLLPNTGGTAPVDIPYVPAANTSGRRQRLWCRSRIASVAVVGRTQTMQVEIHSGLELDTCAAGKLAYQLSASSHNGRSHVSAGEQPRIYFKRYKSAG